MYVCMYVCLSVCLSTRIPLKPCVHTVQNVLYTSSVDVATMQYVMYMYFSFVDEVLISQCDIYTKLL